MDDTTVLVLGNREDAEIAKLRKLPENFKVSIGNKLEDVEQAAPGAEVICHWSAKPALLRQVWPLAGSLKWVHSRAAGLDNLLFPELVESPVPLTNGRGVFSQSLGEFVIAAALYFAKDFRRMVNSQMAGRWDPFDVVEIRHHTMGIVGYGDIGRAAAWRAHAFGMKVLALRRRPELSQGDPSISKVFAWKEKHAMLEQCDYVVAAAPLTNETRGMLSDAEFAVMKPSAVVINVGRGPVIDEAALIRALESGRIKGAGLDVFEREPLPDGHPFYRLENVLLSPHCADHTPEWLDNAMDFFIENLQRYARGEGLVNVVDKRSGY